MSCRHVVEHEVKPPVNVLEEDFRKWMAENGWLDAGYCEAYYPIWLWHPYLAGRGGLVVAEILGGTHEDQEAA